MTEAPLLIDQIVPQYRDRINTQSYRKKPVIEGVQLLDLALFSDEGGAFAEVARLNREGRLEAWPDFQPRQVSYSQVLPGAIKAFHLHYRQEDLWYVCPSDRLLVGLVDTREGSPTEGLHMRLTLGAGRGRLLLIPRGVAHGCANLTGAAATLLYFTNAQFDPDNPDEQRLPSDLLDTREEYRDGGFWRIIPG
jgi:dTDP-4-dehydrorhamnose 3,5-epimerase